MTATTLNKAFEPFFTTKEMGKGSGLGLSMVYGFVKQSGGHIMVESVLERGTTITIYLPRSQQVALIEDDDATVTEVSKQVGNILVVEDDPDLRELAATILNAYGYEVSVAVLAEEAIDLLQQDRKFDLLFTDIVLSAGMDGVELAQAASRLQPDIKVLFASGYSKHALILDGKLKQSQQFISKPYRFEELTGLIQTLLGSDAGADE